MGVTGVHPEEGVTTGDLEEAYMKRALSGRAAETIVMASSEKMGLVSPYVILPIDRVSQLVVEENTKKSLLDPYLGLGLTVIYA